VTILFRRNHGNTYQLGTAQERLGQQKSQTLSKLIFRGLAMGL
jgi:hypothetical protein